MRCFVTGASGFVGANLVRRLLREGHEVHVLLRPGHSAWRLDEIRRDLRVQMADLTDRRLVGVVKAVRPEWVFHLAAHGAYSSQTDLQRIVLTNIIGTINLVKACLAAGFESFVNTGSSSEYGFKEHAPSEDEPLEPNSYYAVTKASATLICRYLAQSRGLHLPTLRLYSVYGPYEEPTRLMPTMIVRGLHGEWPPLVSPDVARDFVYVEDVVEAYLRAAARPGKEPGAIYNVGTEVQTSMREAVEVARNVLGIKAKAKWGTMPNRQWDTNIWKSDNRKIKRELGWKPRTTFEQGFRLMADWLRANPKMLRFYERRLK